MKEMIFTLSSPDDKKTFTGVTLLGFESEKGPFTVLPGHERMAATVSEGKIRIKTGAEEIFVSSDGGLLFTENDNHLLLTAHFE